MTNGIAWPEGTYFSCDDPEVLTHTDPWSAIEEYLDGFLYPKMSIAEVVGEIGSRSITLTAYRPMELSDNQIAMWASLLTENLEEMFREEHGDPEGEGPLCAEADTIMREATTKIIRASKVWGCEESGKVELTGEQVLALAQRERPDWFEPAMGKVVEP